MLYRTARAIFLPVIVYVFIFAGPVTAGSLAAEKSAAGDAPKSGASGTRVDDADDAPGRKLPQLQPGKWETLFEMGESIYPSVVISTATLKNGLWDDGRHLGDPWGTIGIVVRGIEKDCPVTVEISGGNFIGPSVFTGTLPDKDAIYCIYPELKYDYEKLLAVKQTIPEALSFKVRIGSKQEPEKIARVQVRPINECVYNFADSSGSINDVSFFFAAYVNENHPIISQILKEAIDSKRVDSFSGYSGEKEDVMAEVKAVWAALKKRGLHYSTITASADDDNPYISSQYVRLLGESINYTQANCVDGSVLMASIFRKIGLNVSLIELPDHMFLSVSLDEEGKEMVFIETTILGSGDLDEAMDEGRTQYTENKDKFDSKKEDEQAYNIINIQDARVLGIMPIKDSSAN
ncbi:MAG: hypothetical protein WC522_02595 [Candidatus Omnitrophota bacterium]